MAELKARKQRALDLLVHIPHVIPHRKVRRYIIIVTSIMITASVLTWNVPQLHVHAT